MKNTVESIKAKLKTKAMALGKDYNYILLLYFQERFLYRLSLSRYKNNFILKGGLLLAVFDIDDFRVTKDIDFLGKNIINTAGEIGRAVKAIFDTKVTIDDGIVFHADHLRIETITAEANYSGLRVSVDGNLGNIKKTLTIDIGFGDAVIPKPQKIEFPTLLEQPGFQLSAYNPENIISEKIEAICTLGVVNSRMKDFYDIMSLFEKGKIDPNAMQKAIDATFINRGTDKSLFRMLSSADLIKDRSQMWEQFQTKLGLKKKIDFENALRKIVQHFSSYFQ